MLASKNKINTLLAFVYKPNGNEMDQMVRNEMACNCILIVRIAFRYAHISVRIITGMDRNAPEWTGTHRKGPP